jgi:hypothetical protein
MILIKYLQSMEARAHGADRLVLTLARKSGTMRPDPIFSTDIPMTDTPATSPAPALPDHLSADPRSPHHVAAVFEHDIGIRLNGNERSDVEEYCISEGWVKVPAGKTRDRQGRPLLLKIKGKVEAFYR